MPSEIEATAVATALMAIQEDFIAINDVLHKVHCKIADELDRILRRDMFYSDVDISACSKLRLLNDYTIKLRRLVTKTRSLHYVLLNVRRRPSIKMADIVFHICSESFHEKVEEVLAMVTEYYGQMSDLKDMVIDDIYAYLDEFGENIDNPTMVCFDDIDRLICKVMPGMAYVENTLHDCYKHKLNALRKTCGLVPIHCAKKELESELRAVRVRSLRYPTVVIRHEQDT